MDRRQGVSEGVTQSEGGRTGIRSESHNGWRREGECGAILLARLMG